MCLKFETLVVNSNHSKHQSLENSIDNVLVRIGLMNKWILKFKNWWKVKVKCNYILNKFKEQNVESYSKHAYLLKYIYISMKIGFFMPRSFKQLLTDIPLQWFVTWQ